MARKTLGWSWQRGRRTRVGPSRRRLDRATTAAVEQMERRFCLAATFTAGGTVALGGAADFVDHADFNGDGKRDLVVSSYAKGRVSVLLGNGDGTFQSPVHLSLASAPDHVAATDLNGDGKDDLVIASYDANAVGVMLGNGDGSFQPLTSYAAGTGPRMVALGDFTGDGRADIVVGKSFSKTFTILRNNGNGTFQAAQNAAVSFTPVDLVTGDFNGDGKLDVAAADYFANRVVILLGTGNATFLAPTTYATASGPASIATGDFDGDGKLDVVTANFLSNNVSLLRGNGNGTLQAASTLAAGGGATAVAVADLDGDGTHDVAVANANADTLTVLFNNPGGTFDGPASYAVGDSPRSLAIANFNGGGLDLAVANQSGGSVSLLLGGGVAAAPVANAGGPYSVNEGGTVQLSGLASTGVQLTYEWDLDNDGLYGETGAAAKRGDEVGPTPVFSAVGIDGPDSRTARLRVTSGTGATATASATVWIQNVAPTLSISGNATVAEGAPYTLNLLASDPGVDTITAWTINWGDGTVQVVAGNPASVTRAFADNGAYTITATATDEDGTWSAGNSRAVTVSNVAPTLSIGGNANATVGQPYTLNLASNDPGADTIVRWNINWGDGSSSVVDGNPSSTTKTFAAAGTYTITATATDEDGTWSAGNARTVSASMAPSASAGGPYAVAEGGGVALGGAGSTGSGLTYAWDLDGDGVFGESGAGALLGSEVGVAVTLSAATLDGPSTRAVRLRVTDSIGRTSTASATVEVSNAAPTLTIAGNPGVVLGQAYALSLSAADPGPDTITGWLIDWGDGTTTATVGTPAQVSKAYAAAGAYTVTAAATDEDGTWSSNPLAVLVSDEPDTIPPTAALPALGTTNKAGGSSRWFNVNYDDNVAVDVATLGNGDLLVTGPNGYGVVASLISVADGPGAARVATYSIAAPGGSWDFADNGTYTFSLVAAQVADTSGNPAAPGVLGSLSVAIPPPDSAGNDFATARDLGTFTNGTSRAPEDMVGPADKNDFFRLTLDARMDFVARLTGLTAAADLWLYDANGATVASSRKKGASDEAIAMQLAAGTYFARVAYTGTTDTTAFRLALATTAISIDPGVGSAVDRGTLAGGAVSVATGVLSTGDRYDYYKFSIGKTSTVYLKLYELADNADLQILNSSGQVVSSSKRTGTSDDAIRVKLAAGTYYVRVNLVGMAGTTYRLRFANETP